MKKIITVIAMMLFGLTVAVMADTYVVEKFVLPDNISVYLLVDNAEYISCTLTPGLNEADSENFGVYMYWKNCKDWESRGMEDMNITQRFRILKAMAQYNSIVRR